MLILRGGLRNDRAVTAAGAEGVLVAATENVRSPPWATSQIADWCRQAGSSQDALTSRDDKSVWNGPFRSMDAGGRGVQTHSPGHTADQLNELGTSFSELEKQQFGREGFAYFVNQVAAIEMSLGIYYLDPFTTAPLSSSS